MRGLTQGPITFLCIFIIITSACFATTEHCTFYTPPEGEHQDWRKHHQRFDDVLRDLKKNHLYTTFISGVEEGM